MIASEFVLGEIERKAMQWSSVEVSALSLSLAILYLFDEWKNFEHKLVACGHRLSHIKSNAGDHICPSWPDG